MDSTNKTMYYRPEKVMVGRLQDTMSDVFHRFFADLKHEESFNSCCKALKINDEVTVTAFYCPFCSLPSLMAKASGQMLTKEY